MMHTPSSGDTAASGLETAVATLPPLPAGDLGGIAVISRSLPFAVFMAFIALDEVVRLTAGPIFALPPEALYYLYPVKASAVALLLYLYRRHYTELSLSDLAKDASWIWVSLAGLATFLLWVCMDWTLPMAVPAGFDPTLLPAGPVRLFMTLSRVAGAVLVVPLMEELFWRSFLLRYLVAADFESVPLGRFTWTSFLVASFLFGLEHHFVVAGVAAAVIYTLILYKTRSIAHCVLAHAVTNLALACYVLSTGKWYFW